MTATILAIAGGILIGLAIGWGIRDWYHHRYDGSTLKGLFDLSGRL